MKRASIEQTHQRDTDRRTEVDLKETVMTLEEKFWEASSAANVDLILWQRSREDYRYSISEAIKCRIILGDKC